MPTIDERVVAMAFENQVFEQRVAQTMATLTKLDTAIKNVGQSNGLENIEKAANKVTLQGPMSALDKLKSRFGGAGQGAAEGFNEIERAGNKVTLEQPMSALDKLRSRLGNVGANAADGFNEIEKASNHTSLTGVNNALNNVIGKFSVLQGAASVALGNIATQATQRGGAFAKSFSFGPILQGFQEYQTNLGSIQTIMANTEGQRVSGLKETNKHLNELNAYSDKTIYNFSQMAKNIGTFTAAGVDLDTSTKSIKGIANLAALSGSSAEQASTAMYQLSQAIAAGRVGLQDWNSVVNAGMGGRKFQNSLIQTGVAMGTIEKGAVKIDKATGKATINGENFRNSIMAAPGKESWLTSEVLTSSLGQFTGDMTDAQLAAKGFNAEQIKSIQATAKSAQNAATQVKTLPQVFDVAREAIGSGWAQTFSNIFGNFQESKKLFTGLSNTINGIIGDNAKARNKMLAEWKKGGGRIDLIEGIKAGFQALFAILKPIKDAFRDIFPAKTGKDLIEMTKNFRQFMEHLKPSAEVVDGLRRTFRGLFAVLHIGWEIFKGVVGVIGDLLGLAGKGAGGFLSFTGSIGDLAVALDKALTQGGLLKAFFKGLTNILRIPLEILQSLGSAFSGLFSDDSAAKIGKAGDAAKGFGDKFAPLEEIIDRVKKAIEKTIHVVNKFFEPFAKLVSGIGKAFANIGTEIANALSSVDLDTVFKGLNTAILGGIFLAIKKFMGEGSLIVIKPLKQVGEALNGMTGVLKNMQTALKAGIILAIATAILALAVGVKVLADIDPKRLSQAMTGVAIGLGELVGAIGILQAMTKGKGAISLPVIAAGMVALAGAVVVLAGAMKIFATMSWDELTRGLVGVGGSLYAIGVGIKAIGPSITLAAPGILGVAVAMNVLAVAMKIFGQMKMGELAKGIVGIGLALAALKGGIANMGPELLLVGPGLIAAGFGLSVIASGIAVIGKMDLKTLIQGTLGMTTALGLLGVALQTMPPGPMLAAQAAGLLLAGIALTAVGGAVKVMGSMNLAQMAKGLIVLGAALFELAVGLDIMATTIPGAAALLLAATALAVLTPVLAILGTLSWEVLGKGLVAVAGALAVLGIVGGVASPGILALGLALTALGLAVVTIGAGVYLIVKALILLGDASVKSTGILIAAITAFIAAIPKLVIEFLKGILEIAKGVAVIAPQLVVALSNILNMLLDTIIKSTPKLAQAIGTLIDGILLVVVRDSPKLIQAGVTLILNLLKGIDQNITQVVNRVASIITKFLDAFAAKAPALTAAGARALIAFLSGVAAHLADVVATGGKVLTSFLLGIAKAVPRIVGAVGTLIAKFIWALGNQLPKIGRAAVHLATKFIQTLGHTLLAVVDVAADTVIKFMNKLAATIEQHAREFVAAGYKIGVALLKGVVEGMGDLKQQFDDFMHPEAKESRTNVASIRQIRDRDHRTRHWFETHNAAGFTQGELDQVFGPKSKLSAAASEGGKQAANKVATGFTETGKKVIPPAVDEATSSLKKPIAVGKVDATQLQKSAPVVQAAAAQVAQKVEKPFEPLGIKVGGHMVNGLKVGLRNLIPVMMAATNPAIKGMFQLAGGMREMGQFLGGEFRQGLTGGLWDDGKSEARRQIEGAFKSLRAKLGEERQKLKDQLKQDAGELKQLMGERDKNWAKIGALQQRIAQERATLAQSKGASRSLMATLMGEQSVLVKLAANYETVTKRLEAAKAKLDALKDDRKQAIQDYTNQFSQLPDIGQLLDQAMSDASMTWAEKWDAQRKKQEDDQQRRQINQVANYKKALQDQIAATLKYNETLNKLRALGLDDVTYKKLLEMGTAGQEFASQLLSQGKPAIDSINALDKQLSTAAGDLGKSAAASLYDAGIQAAKGVVEGLKAQQSEIRKAMTEIAKSLVFALKWALGIKSPSRVMAELGVFTAQGLAEGLKASSNLVQDAAGGIGDDAADALSNSLAKISDHVQNGIDTDVTITPVLDLSQVEKDASKIQDLSNVVPITAAASYGQAAAISQTTQETAAAQADAGVQKIIEVNLEQNNTSPKALDDVEIYRQTKNQLSQVKSALGLPM